MKQTERGLMLLCLPLGDTLAGALSLAQARELSKRARAIGIGEDDPLREVTQKDVQRLGYSEAEAAHIVALLNRERQLDGYLLAAEKAGVTVVTRLDARFPQRLREQLGARCPAALFCRGDMSLLQSRCISVVGSRQLHSLGAAFAAQAGRLAAQEGYTLCSGDAMGADRTAQELACKMAAAHWFSRRRSWFTARCANTFCMPRRAALSWAFRRSGRCPETG